MDRLILEPLEYDWSATTDSQGRFQWDSAPSGEHPYLFTADGYNLRCEPALVADVPSTPSRCANPTAKPTWTEL